jgi:hypothetical protein
MCPDCVRRSAVCSVSAGCSGILPQAGLSRKDETPAVWPVSRGRLHRDRSGVFPHIVQPLAGDVRVNPVRRFLQIGSPVERDEICLVIRDEDALPSPACADFAGDAEQVAVWDHWLRPETFRPDVPVVDCPSPKGPQRRTPPPGCVGNPPSRSRDSRPLRLAEPGFAQGRAFPE